MPGKKDLAKYLFFLTALAVAAQILWPSDTAPESLPVHQPLTSQPQDRPKAPGIMRSVAQPVASQARPRLLNQIEPENISRVGARSRLLNVHSTENNISRLGASPGFSPIQPWLAPKRLIENTRSSALDSDPSPRVAQPFPAEQGNIAPESGIGLADYTVRIKNHDRATAFVTSSLAKNQTQKSKPKVQGAESSKLKTQSHTPTDRLVTDRRRTSISTPYPAAGSESATGKTDQEFANSVIESSARSRPFDAFENQDRHPATSSRNATIGTNFSAVDRVANSSAHEALGSHNPIVPTAGFTFDPPEAQSSGPSQSPQGTTSFRLADQPKLGEHYKAETPQIDCNAHQIETLFGDFSPDPVFTDYPYDPCSNQNIYQCKQLNANQRPLLELGRPWYQLGQLSPGSSVLGFHNNVNPQFLIFGDYRQAYASNRSSGDSNSQLAFELNTIWNLFITSTERVVWGTAPFDNGADNTHYDFERDSFEVETDFDIDFGYFEGDLGAIVGGFVGKTLPFDAPFAVGLTPILIQNGIWLNDAVEGLFFTIPARSSARLGISNMDISFGFVWDEINSAAFADDNNAAKAYLIYTFIEALNGYFEIDYAFLEDRNLVDRSYHNISMAYSRRFGNFISHSTRVIANAGQAVTSGPQTADGVLLLLENSLITSNPYTVVPYFNLFAGFDTPQSVAGNQQLIATGILFESDGMTNYPTLDSRGSDTFGGAMGLNLLAQDFSQQLILEAAAVFRGDDSDLAGDQYGLGIRHQIPLNNSWILRSDAMYGFLRGTDDSTGARIELRKKF